MENQLMLHICEVYVFALINLPGRKLQAPKGGRQRTMPVLGVAKPRCRTKKYINKICELFLKLQNSYTLQRKFVKCPLNDDDNNNNNYGMAPNLKGDCFIAFK